ncbi:MAG: flagellar motor protein MotB [Holophaga sp.]|nr:flagellar motor protein MotB [Holophaga sp.]
MARVPLRPTRRKDDYDGLWLITFADLMVQLMAFFAVIYSFSAQDTQKLQLVLQSFQHELGVKGTGILPGNLGIDPNRAADLEKQLSDLQPVAGADVGVRMHIVSFRGAVLFEEGSASVPRVFQPLLTRINQMARDYPGFTLICEGHAAPRERGGSGADALALSGQRAEATVRTLVQQGMDPASVAAEAHGDSQIDGDPGSPEGRALQRRVKFRFQRVAER